MMNSKIRSLGGSMQADKGRSGMVSPTRNDKLSPTSKSTTYASSKNASISIPTGAMTASTAANGITSERKGSILSQSSKGFPQMSLTQSKKVSNVSGSQSDLVQTATAITNVDGAPPLPQLDISGITPSDLKNDSNGSMTNAFSAQSSSVKLAGTTPLNHLQKSKPVSTTNAVNLSNSNNNNNNNNTLNVSVSPVNTSFTQIQKSPSKGYQPSTPSQQQGKKVDPTAMPLMQSTNMGVVDAANISMQVPSSSSQQYSNTAQAAAAKEMDLSVNFEVLKQFDQKQKSSNIKTFIRVRPLNKMEIEFNENGCGNENLRFPDSKTVQVMPEKANYILDKVYPPNSVQEEIFEDVGKEMVNDVLQGYNGTIFAYGPTGSGKTFTMFGDVNDAKKKGIIPRVANQIFTYINSVDQDIEFTITVSMLEIYKEQLFDLLKVDRVGLKIKENPQKGGIYVQGLTAISVDCEEEILDTINLGYSSKQTRETRMNEYSSRSHTIFTINVTQRYPNGQEKIGKLNLVDLAGSEKVGKTQASGETLEEAKKINLSLSCLGNVIHALTSNQEHIPYRDSKLTRILQESLGGNYKTSLVAAISPHSSQHEEQQSTLKFATRAKTIKNVVKMNVKLSLDQMRKLIEQLKTELEKAKAQNLRFRTVIKKLREEFKANQLAIPLGKDGKVTEQHQVMQNTVKALDDILNSSELDVEDVSSSKQADSIGKTLDSKTFYEDSELEDTAGELKLGPSQFSGKRMKNYQNQSGGNSDSHGRSGSMGNSNTQQSQGNLDYKTAYQEKLTQCRNLEKELMELKRTQLETERKLADVHEEKHKVEVNHTQQVTKNNYNNFEIEIMQKQIQSLIDSICKSENTIGALMKEKQEIAQKKIEDLLKEKLTFSEIHFSEYFKKSINFNYDNLVQKWTDVQKNMKTIGIDDQELFKSAAEFSVLDNASSLKERNAKFGKHTQPVPQKQSIDDIIKGSFIGNLDFNAVSNPYDMLGEMVEFPDQLDKFSQKHPISRDLTIILLKKQIFNSHIINQHLARTINALEWKQIIEYGKAKMKSVLNKIQSTHISNLEQVINEASQNYRQLRNRIESVELETQFVREKIDSQNNNDSAAPKKSKIIKDAESIRHLLMKPSNDGIRQSLRGSYIGFQLDLDKTSETPLLRELKETDELLAKDLLPLTYDRAIEELKHRNSLVRRSYSEFKGTNAFNGMNSEFIEQVLKEKERLEGKITMLSNELKMEIGKSEHYADAYKAEKSNFQMQKEQTKELEQFLVTKMKEENEQLENTQKKISDQHEKEILKYQQSFQRVSEKFQEYIRNSLGRLSELKKSNGPIQTNQIDQMFQEILMIKEQYNKMFNPDGNSAIQNPTESPQNNFSMGFNPNSMIFKSFENYTLEGQASSMQQISQQQEKGTHTWGTEELRPARGDTVVIADEVKEPIGNSLSVAVTQPAGTLYGGGGNENFRRASNLPMQTGTSTPSAPQSLSSISFPTSTHQSVNAGGLMNKPNPSGSAAIAPSTSMTSHYKQNSSGSYYSSTGYTPSYTGSAIGTRGLPKYGQFNSNTNNSSLSYSSVAAVAAAGGTANISSGGPTSAQSLTSTASKTKPMSSTSTVFNQSSNSIQGSNSKGYLGPRKY